MKIFDKSATDDFTAEALKHELWTAVTAANIYKVEQSIEKGAKPNTDMLVYAVGAQKSELARTLMEAGVKPHSGMMFIALNNKDEKMISALVEYNVPMTPDDPRPRPEFRRT